MGPLKGDPRVDATIQGTKYFTPQSGYHPQRVDPITYRGPASLHHHHGTVWMIIAGGPKSRTIMTAEKAWPDVCGKGRHPNQGQQWLSTGMIPNPRGKPTLLPSPQPAVSQSEYIQPLTIVCLTFQIGEGGEMSAGNSGTASLEPPTPRSQPSPIFLLSPILDLDLTTAKSISNRK